MKIVYLVGAGASQSISDEIPGMKMFRKMKEYFPKETNALFSSIRKLLNMTTDLIGKVIYERYYKNVLMRTIESPIIVEIVRIDYSGEAFMLIDCLSFSIIIVGNRGPPIF